MSISSNVTMIFSSADYSSYIRLRNEVLELILSVHPIYPCLANAFDSVNVPSREFDVWQDQMYNPLSSHFGTLAQNTTSGVPRRKNHPPPLSTKNQQPTILPTKMKILTTSFLTCAVKACKSSPLSFPLHYKDAELEQSDIAYNPQFLINILPRIDWDAVRITAAEVIITSHSVHPI